MLLSLSLIIIVGLGLSLILRKIKMPALIGYMLTGIILGPYVLNMIDQSILNISTELRQIALIIILLRAGLSLNINDLRKIGRPAVLLCFVPAIVEIIAVAIFAPMIFNISYLDAVILGCILGAVSPAVIVPFMLKMIEIKQGTNKNIPQLIMAGASLDDVFTIALFAMFLAISIGDKISFVSIIGIPISLVLGVAIGIILGLLLVVFFKRMHIRDSVKVIIIISIAFGLHAVEELLKGILPFSGLLAIMTMGIIIASKYEILSERLSIKYSKLWIIFEIMLFVLVGAAVEIDYFLYNIWLVALLIVMALIIRTIGVFLSLIKTRLQYKERLFCSIAYIPKATVQAAIGGIPLAMGLMSGELILSAAAASILITAPLGAYLIEYSRNKLLTYETIS